MPLPTLTEIEDARRDVPTPAELAQMEREVNEYLASAPVPAPAVPAGQPAPEPGPATVSPAPPASPPPAPSPRPDFIEVALPALKTSRLRRVHFSPGGPGWGTAIIATENSITEYVVREFRADGGGRGFEFAKRDGSGERYNVYLANDIAADAGFAWDSCDCPGGTYHAAGCRHIEAARVITDRGMISLPAPVAAKPVLLCTKCRKRPRDCAGYLCDQCEGGRM